MRMRKLIDKARGKAKMSERSEQEPQTASSATISSESDGSLPSSSSSSSQCRSLLDVLKAPQRSLLVQPSSAAAERVFSILNSSFGDKQQHALEDYIEASIQLQYNCR